MRAALAHDRELAEPLALEAQPVLQALAESAAEASALANLLGRRAGLLGLTPGGVLAVAPALVDSVDDNAEDVLHTLNALCLEGYVAAREEVSAQQGAERAAAAIAQCMFAQGCVGVFVRGDQDADAMEARLSEIARDLLDRDAKACVVHAARLIRPSRDRAMKLFSLAYSCRLLGVRCIYSAVGDDWLKAAEEGGFDLNEVEVDPSFESALNKVLAHCGLQVRNRHLLARWLD